MRLAFISWYSGLGGGETDILAQAAQLPAEFAAPHLIVPRMGALGEAWQRAGWPLHIVPFRGASSYFVPQLWARFPVVRRLAALLKQQAIQLIHSDYHALPLIAPAADALAIPLVWTIHGWWFKPKPWQRAFLTHYPAVARSHAIRAGFLGQPPLVPPEHIPIIYSGVDSQRFHPAVDGAPIRAQVGIPSDAPVVALIARFQAVKGHHRLQNIALRVLDALPHAHFLVAGEETFGVGADQAYKQQILARHQADERLRAHVHYLGFRNDPERVMAAADVVICPSTFESYGKVNLEAQASARPVVSSNQGGPTETVRDGITGYLLHPDDEAGFAARLIALLNDPTLRAQMGAAGRAWVQERFSLAQMGEQYAALFQQATRGKNVL